MPITLPNLDDREYADLVSEAKALIPQLAPSWTDHNPSDPEITLIELFAYICEMLMYRNDQVTGKNKLMFLQLLMGADWKNSHSGESENRLIQSAIAELRTEERAITNADFERLALEAGNGDIAKVYCRARRDYTASRISDDVVGHVSLVIIPANVPFEALSGTLINTITDYLNPRLLLTTRLHVVPANFVSVDVEVELKIADDYRQAEVQKSVYDQLATFFHPVVGGKDGQGWKPGQSIYISDIYALLDRVPGVDYVSSLSVVKEDDDKPSGGDSNNPVTLMENELPLFDAEQKCKTDEMPWITFVKKEESNER